MSNQHTVPQKEQTATTQMTTPTIRPRMLWALVGLILLLGAGAQLIGPAVIPLGFASLTILPMVWGLVAGAVVSGQRVKPMPLVAQYAASTIMSIAVLLLCARLAFTIGPNLGLLFEAGPALLLQEAGHLFGTILLALPLAVLLKMGPATIGATFSIDREGSFAMVSERYGPNSPQYHGVLSMYVFGTVFGAILISLFASIATSLGIFDPLALAMGAGVGSGSMMAAGAASVAAAHPELSDQVLALAATSNLITSILGIYVGMYVALPLAGKLYGFLTRRSVAPRTTAAATATAQAASPVRTTQATAEGTTPNVEAARSATDSKTTSTTPGTEAAPPAPSASVIGFPEKMDVTIPLWTTLIALLIVGIPISSIAAGQFSLQIVGGYLIMAALVAIGVLISRVSRGKVAAIISVITIGALASSSLSPIAGVLGEMVATIDFLSVCTVVLTVAGLSLGKDLPMLKTIGWKIIPVGIVSIAASYLLSVFIAEFALGFWG
ncbi:DUF3100 domain-containing protein [Lysinibacter sp. HNR]|uniref:DUF3100 domain-containing protein n=1 Tax=Lysinibacter sp. HNR TaxID=3031408 RepID=UPI0024356F1A|nr:DUF3100 domain-containing protein [Lysinibacter sp. HNR]WGD37070.1 DUF3100 domain-containing protein [Lysinibacter sp. HNR]